MQSFASAAERISVQWIAKRKGLLFRSAQEGKDLVAALERRTRSCGRVSTTKKSAAVRCQCFPWEMDALTRSGAIYEAQAGTGVFCLLEGFYSDEFGLTLDGSGRMESMIA